MEALIRELESLRRKPELSSRELLGAILASTVRMREVFEMRMIGIQSLSTAIAMEPQVDALKLHDDFVSYLRSHFDAAQEIPTELRDVAAAIKLSAAERQ